MKISEMTTRQREDFIKSLPGPRDFHEHTVKSAMGLRDFRTDPYYRHTFTERRS